VVARVAFLEGNYTLNRTVFAYFVNTKADKSLALGSATLPIGYRGRNLVMYVGLYKILLYFEAHVHESILFYPPTHPHCPHYYNIIARLLSRIRLPLRTLVCMLYTIQYW